MASLQTSALHSGPNAANAAIKASLTPSAGDKDDFAAMLKGDASAQPVKPDAPKTSKAADVKTAAAQPQFKAMHDAHAGKKTDAKTQSKPERKSAAKPNDPADGKSDAAKPVIAKQAQQPADTQDTDSDTADNNADAQTPLAANQNAADPATAQTSAQTQPPAQPDASAQAQQMLAAAPGTGPQTAPAAKPANDNNSVTGAGSSAKAGRAPAPAAPVTPQDAPSTDAPDATAKAVPATVQDFLKAAGHADAKTQTADTAKADPAPASVASDAAPAAPQPTPPAPPASAMAANAAGMTAPGASNPGAPAAAIHGANPGASLHVAPPTPNVNSLAVEIAARSQSGAKEFQIRLDPPELGHVEVRLSIDASGKAEAHMTADQQQTLDLLQKNSPTLTSALRDAGLDVSQSGLNFSLRGQDRQGADHQGGAQTRGTTTALAATKTIDAVQSANPYLSSAGDARLDIHV